MVRVSLIVAMAKNRVIGIDNQLPWHLPADLKHFKATTMSKPIVMGRKTWESIGRPLPGRSNIVVSRRAGFVAEGAAVVSNVADGLELARSEAAAAGLEEIFVIGGETIYRQVMDLVDRVFVTEVDLEPEGDAWFPKMEPNDWKEVARECYPVTSDGSPGYCFVTLQRWRQE
ncbi:Dihydrofolate reductase type 3 [Zhongshania aliphaticivorans]|uniref:Dihydrofolate reductase n=1 Tax=Zhongshania aliphaticivorans TaxID=1470434 RepID=A0A5S9MT33_9GAMM|nr:dihydrofolate reductase [Zhongshania aliphaticivorans]CAA0080013.1 Dihydrofolate reductase type 3 [Zhongshania aliphaticivorans]CAA0085920.1 Dihydrofolate reductase type 3 [Zhongshania aliphaticivorans]